MFYELDYRQIPANDNEDQRDILRLVVRKNDISDIYVRHAGVDQLDVCKMYEFVNRLMQHIRILEDKLLEEADG